jgi:hypothetical protein
MPKAMSVNSQAAIWARIIAPEKNGFSPAVARAFLQLGFSAWDQARMNELAQKNQDGLLSEAERQELADYVKVGDVLALLHLKARKSLPG